MNKANNGLGVAVVGCGYWGINYLRVFDELPQVRRVVAVDQRLPRLEMVSERFSDVEVAFDIEQVLDRSDIHAAVICTPASSHHEIGTRLMEAGKHLLVEKPAATTAADAEDLMRQADLAGLTLTVGHTFLYNSAVDKVKSYVRDGHVGQLYYLYSQRTNLGPIREDVNALWDLAPHDISIFNYLLDASPVWVSATGRNVLGNSRADFGFVALGYPNGIIGHLHVSWADPQKVRRLAVVGSQRRVVFDDLKTAEQVRVYEKGVSPAEEEALGYGEHRLLIRDGDIISPKIDVSEPLKNQCIDFIECIGNGHRPVSDGRAGLAVVETMEAIDRSLNRDGQPVAVGSTVPAASSNGHHSDGYWSPERHAS